MAEDYKLLFNPISAQKRELVVKMPMFRLEEGNDVCEVLEHTLIFRKLLNISAQYTKLTRARTYIRHIIHKIFLSINEDGINVGNTENPKIRQTLKVEPDEEVMDFSKSFVFIVREREGCEVLLASVVDGSNPPSYSHMGGGAFCAPSRHAPAQFHVQVEQRHATSAPPRGGGAWGRFLPRIPPTELEHQQPHSCPRWPSQALVLEEWGWRSRQDL